MDISVENLLTDWGKGEGRAKITINNPSERIDPLSAIKKACNDISLGEGIQASFNNQEFRTTENSKGETKDIEFGYKFKGKY